MLGPPFDSIHHGVQFAYANGAPSCGSNWPNMGPRGASGLSRLDVHAQAGQVQLVIGRLKPDEVLWVQLAYGPLDEVDARAVDMVPFVLAQLPTGAYKTRLIADLVMWNCGRREAKSLSLRRMAARGEMSNYKLGRLALKVGQIMQQTGVRAFEALDRSFGEHQWLVG